MPTIMFSVASPAYSARAARKVRCSASGIGVEGLAFRYSLEDAGGGAVGVFVGVQLNGGLWHSRRGCGLGYQALDGDDRGVAREVTEVGAHEVTDCRVETFPYPCSVSGAANGMLGRADFQGAGVGLEALLSGDLDAVGQKGPRLFFRQGDYRHGFQKVINAEGRAVASGACRRKGVARACDVVPENVGRVVSQEQGPGVLDEADIAVGVCGP